MKKKKRGFASLSKERLRELCSKGGTNAHKLGHAHQWDSKSARHASKKRWQMKKVLNLKELDILNLENLDGEVKKNGYVGEFLGYKAAPDEIITLKKRKKRWLLKDKVV